MSGAPPAGVGRVALADHRERLEAALDRATALAGPGGVVSLDVFSTLLVRLLPDSHVRSMAARELSRRAGGTPGVETILEHRRAHALAVERGTDYLLSGWLSRLAQEHRLPARAVEHGLEAELEAELTFTAPATGTGRILRALRSRSVTLVAVSDTWLDEELLSRLLRRHGLDLDRVFSSAGTGRSKRRGDLFALVNQELRPGAVVHVGDNLKSDLARPYGGGWTGIWLPPARAPGPGRLSRRLPASRRDTARDILRTLHADAPVDVAPLYAASHQLLAPLLGLHMLLAGRIFARHGVEHMLFLARDTHLIKAAAEELRDLGLTFPGMSYLRLARKAVILSHADDLLPLVKLPSGRFGADRVDRYLDHFWLPGGLRNELISRAGLTLHGRLDEQGRRALGRAVAELKPKLHREQARQQDLVRRFLRQHVGDARRVGIIDVGWAGTTQDVIAHVEPDFELVAGVYLGLSASGQPPGERLVKAGLLRDDHAPPPGASALQRLYGTVRFWDTVLREPAGSATALEEDGEGKVRPLLTPSPAEAEEADALELEAGLRAGVGCRGHGFRALAAADGLADDDLRAAAVLLGQRLTAYPPPGFARRLLALRYDEPGGAVRTLAWSPLRPREGWLPGELSWRGLGPLLPLVERGVDLVGALTAWRGGEGRMVQPPAGSETRPPKEPQ